MRCGVLGTRGATRLLLRAEGGSPRAAVSWSDVSRIDGTPFSLMFYGSFEVAPLPSTAMCLCVPGVRLQLHLELQAPIIKV